MTILSACSGHVKPLTAPRTTNGQFASPANLACIIKVKIANRDDYSPIRYGYQVGPNGVIHASYEAAVRHANSRARKLAETYDASGPRGMEGYTK